MTANSLDDTAIALAEEFCSLRRRYPELSLFTFEFLPEDRPRLSGEVRGRTIYVYERKLNVAIHTLRHEVYDHLISESVIRPFLELVNRQNDLIFSLIHERKERLVEDLVRGDEHE